MIQHCNIYYLHGSYNVQFFSPDSSDVKIHDFQREKKRILWLISPFWSLTLNYSTYFILSALKLCIWVFVHEFTHAYSCLSYGFVQLPEWISWHVTIWQSSDFMTFTSLFTKQYSALIHAMFHIDKDKCISAKTCRAFREKHCVGGHSRKENISVYLHLHVFPLFLFSSHPTCQCFHWLL